MSKPPRTIPEWMKGKGRKKAVGNAFDNIVAAQKPKKSRKKENIFDDLESADRRLSKSNLNQSNSSNGDEEEYSRFANLPLVKYEGKIHYYKDFYEVAEGFDLLLKKLTDEAVPVSFDLEWTFDYKSGPKPVAVMQICMDLDNCYVIQMSTLNNKIPASLTKFLYHPATILHGVNIKNDFRKLARDFSCFKADPLIEKCVELGEFYNRVFNSTERWSLSRLTGQTLKQQVDKSRHLRMSNWNFAPLNETQLMYAAIDVFVSFRPPHHPLKVLKNS